MPFPWAAVAIWLFTSAAQIGLSLQRRVASQLVPSGLKDFQIPTAEEGRPIPAFCGRRLLKDLNVLWYGDYSTVPVEDNGTTIAFKYLLGLQLGIANGPVDELLEVRFDERTVLLPNLDVNTTNNAIVFDDGGDGPFTALIPVVLYQGYTNVCEAAKQAMRTAYGGGGWHVVYGYEIRPNLYDQIEFGVRRSGVWHDLVATLQSPSDDSASALAAMVQAKMQQACDAEFASVGVQVLEFLVYADANINFYMEAHNMQSGVTDWRLHRIVANYDRCVLAKMGFQLGTSASVLTDFQTIQSEFITGPKRISFVFVGTTGVIYLTDPGFTAAALLGFNTGADRTFGSARGDSDRTFTGFSLVDFGDYWRVTVDLPDLFGGELREGGVVGAFDIYKGSTTQVANDYLETTRGRSLPGYRGLAYVAARKPYLGNVPVLKTMSLVMGRQPNGLGITGGMQSIEGDANPACWLYEILTNDIWGLGKPTTEIDAASFIAAGETLFDEGLGVSMEFVHQGAAEEYKREIERLIDGLVVKDPATGLLILKLIRPDYVVGSLPVFDETNCRLVRFARRAPRQLINMAKGTFIDRLTNYTDRVVQAFDLAALQSNPPHPEQFDYRAFSRAAVAQAVLERDLKAGSIPLAEFSILAGRHAALMGEGDPFVLNWPAYGITGLVGRIGQIDPGELEGGMVSIDALEDVFGITNTAYDPPPASGWSDPQLVGWGDSWSMGWGG